MVTEPQTQAVNLREVDLAEATGLSEVEGKHICEVTLIRPGTSKNGNHYPPQVLRESQQLFEGTRAFADHPAQGDRPERSIRDLVGYYRGVKLDESGRLRAHLHLVPGNEWLWHLIQESQSQPDLIGLSINAWGDAEPHQGGQQVTGLRKVDSVDLVTKASAGGSFDRLLQSDRTNPTTTARKDGQMTQDATQDPPAQGTPTQATVPNPEVTQLLETIRQEREDFKKAQDELRRETELARCEATLTSKLTEAQLPDVVSQKLRKRFGETSFERDLSPTAWAAKLEEAINDEKHTLAELSKAGQITGMGYEKTPGSGVLAGMSELDKVQAAMDALFDIYESDQAKSVPRIRGIREAYQICTGRDIAVSKGIDAPLREALATEMHGRQARLQEADYSQLTEAEVMLREADVTTATFSFLLGTSMNKRLLADYQAWPSEWQKFTTTVAIKDFKQQSRVRLGAFGSLSTVAEDAAYTTISLADVQATYTPTKRGNLVQITRETIINDDLYAIKQIPQKLAVAAAFTLAEFVYNLLAPNFGNIYDAHPLFDSINHLNTGVIAANLNTTNSGAALSSAAMQAAVIKMRKQQNLASKPIGLKPRFLLVPPDLEFTAMTMLKSAGLPGGNNNDINPMLGYCEPIVAPQLNALTAGPASTTIWIAIADPRVIDTVEVGFVGGQANPVLLIQDMPLYGLNFTQDVVSYKVRHEYGGAVTDYRGFYLGNN